MKFTLIIILLSLNFLSSAQFDINKVKPKSNRCDTLVTQRKGQRFTDWQCGKTPGVIDCNESLELDPNSNTVFFVSKNVENLDDSNKPFTGKCETCHQNGILERRVTFVGGKENGTDTTFYETGCPQVYRTHVQGEQNGHWTYFHDTVVSIVAWEMNYFAGEKHGQQIFFNKKGDTTLIENYKNGILDGKKIKYFPTGSLKEREINYKNGLMEGEVLYYNKAGKVIEKLNYKEGKKNGECTYFYSDGKLLSTEFWIMDVKSGEFKTFFYQGDLQVLETWKKGSGKEQAYFSFDVFECPSKEAAKEVQDKLSNKLESQRIFKEVSANYPILLHEERGIDQSERDFLKGKKLVRGINETYKYKDKFYVVLGLDRQVIAKKEIKEGAFEEYYPNKKAKRLAVYKNDVLIEEHTFDEFGNELTTFGATTTKKTEDDTVTKGKKKKKKK